MVGREPGGWANARANCRPAGLAAGDREAAGGGVADCPAAGQPAALARRHPRRALAAVPACSALERRASVPTAGWCLGGLRLLEVLVAGLVVVDVVDRLDVGLLAGAVVGRRRGHGAGLLLELGHPV